MIQQNFIDMENMFDLLNIRQEICDVEEAQTIFIRSGEIEFRDVCFSYKELVAMDLLVVLWGGERGWEVSMRLANLIGRWNVLVQFNDCS